MKSIQDIQQDFSNKKVQFHKREEAYAFRDAMSLHLNSHFSSSAVLAAVLFEQIFTTRLIRETANPPKFSPGKENIEEQFENLLKQTDTVINVDKKPFRSITKELNRLGVINQTEKKDYDDFYTNVRNPVAHGLTLRLFERKYGRLPKNTFEIDSNFEKIYESVSNEIIAKIHELMTVKVLRKQ